MPDEDERVAASIPLDHDDGESESAARRNTVPGSVRASNGENVPGTKADVDQAGQKHATGEQQARENAENDLPA